MTRSAKSKTSELIYDDAFVHQSFQAAFGSSAVTNLGAFVAPCDLTLLEVHVRALTAPTADATLDLGSNADDDSLIAAYVMPTSAGYFEADLAAATIVGTTVSKGDYVFFTLNADADGNDTIAVTAVWVPTATQG